jgi:hypothetical protein
MKTRRFRDAVSGMFVKAARAMASPETTVGETVAEHGRVLTHREGLAAAQAVRDEAPRLADVLEAVGRKGQLRFGTARRATTVVDEVAVDIVVTVRKVPRP